MSDEQRGSRLAALLRTLEPKAKEPVSTKVLNTWIAQAESKIGEEAKGGRLGWSSARLTPMAPPFSAEGRHSAPTPTQRDGSSTKDVDGIIHGDLDEFILALDAALDEPWEPLTLRRGEVEVVNVPTKIIKPRRFDIILELRGVTWRRIQFEVSPDEAGISEHHEDIEPPPLSGFGLPDPDALIGIAMRFQIAQKFHAVSDPHEPPNAINDRARDVIDLLLLRDLAATTRSPTLTEVHAAATAVFAARANEAAQLGLPIRVWPPTVFGYPHWADDFTRATESGGIGLLLQEAVAEVNAWIKQIEVAGLQDEEALFGEKAGASWDPAAQ